MNKTHEENKARKVAFRDMYQARKRNVQYVNHVKLEDDLSYSKFRFMVDLKINQAV